MGRVSRKFRILTRSAFTEYCSLRRVRNDTQLGLNSGEGVRGERRGPGIRPPRQRDGDDKMKANRDKRLAVCAAAAALALLAVYVLVAAKHRWFQLPDFDYMKQSRIVQGGFPPPQAASMLWKIGLLLPAAVLLAWALTVSGFRLKLPSLAKDKRFPLILGALAVLLIGCVIVFVLRGSELTDDENTYVFQAKTLLAGRLSNPPPPDLKSFDNKFIINDGSKYVGMYPFGFPMILAIGKLLGSEYAMTLLLAGVLMVLVASLARAVFPDRRVAIVAPLLLFVSPFYYFVSASRLSHVATSVLLGSFALFYIRLFQNGEQNAGRRFGWLSFAGSWRDGRRTSGP